MLIRKATVCDYPAILKLNEEQEHFLSPMDENLLVKLHGQSALALVVEENRTVVAFVLVMREGQNYDSENYRWFSQRYSKFLYVDRIVVGAQCHHCGHGKMLYNEVFSYAGSAGVPVVTAEVNRQPPNPVSLGFHTKRGFEEVGTQWVRGGKKQVTLLAARVEQAGGSAVS